MSEQEFERAMAQVVQGDRAGLREIYENYIGYIYRIIYEILQNRENAEDVTSEFFIRLWDKAEQFQPGGAHRGYLATMARNMAIDFLRKYRREELTDMLQDMSADLNTEEGTGLEEQVVSDMSLEEALGTLKPVERQIVGLKVLGDMTFREIAKCMELPMGTVTWKYQNAIKKLRRCGYE